MAGVIGFWPAVALIVVKAIVAIALWGVAVIGWLGRGLGPFERLLAVAAAFTLVVAVPITDAIGAALVAIFVAVWFIRRPRAAA